MDLHRCDQNNPFRPVDWRFLNANQLAEIPDIQPPQVTDLALRVAVGYLRAERMPQHKAAGADADVLDRAFRLYREDGPLRWELEARVLADQTDEEIGARLNLHPDVVGLFTELFFDVRLRLPVMWLSRHVIIGPDYCVALKEQQVREFWAHEAAVSGLAGVEYAVEEFHRAWRGRGPLTLRVYFRRGVPSELQAKVADFLSRLEEFWQEEPTIAADHLPPRRKRRTKRENGTRCMPQQGSTGRETAAEKPETPRDKRRRSRKSYA
jgi:hypothetical protein